MVYLKKGLLALPANGPFRQVAELRMVSGMTQEIYEAVAPYLTTYGDGTVQPQHRSDTGAAGDARDDRRRAEQHPQPAV